MVTEGMLLPSVGEKAVWVLCWDPRHPPQVLLPLTPSFSCTRGIEGLQASWERQARR